MVKYFQFTPTSDEVFFHTILGNSAFASRMRRSLHFADWSSRGPHPAMINDQHVAFFETQKEVLVDDVWGAGEVLFARKFSEGRLDLVRRIDEMIMRKEKGQIGRGCGL